MLPQITVAGSSKPALWLVVGLFLAGVLSGYLVSQFAQRHSVEAAAKTVQPAAVVVKTKPTTSAQTIPVDHADIVLPASSLSPTQEPTINIVADKIEDLSAMRGGVSLPAVTMAADAEALSS